MKTKFLKWFCRTSLKNGERYNGALCRLKEIGSLNSIFDEEEIGRIGTECLGIMLSSFVLGLLMIVLLPLSVLVGKNTDLNDEDYNEFISMYNEIMYMRES